jgi:hypothetical protein
MARTITQIHKLMLDDIASNEVLSSKLSSNSLYAMYRSFTYIVAVAIFIFEGFFDEHRVEIDHKIINQKSGRLSWYKTMALAFQFGFDLVPDKDYFDNGNATAEQIEASKIIKYAAVGESETESRIIIKIAGEVGGVLTDFTDPAQVEAIEAYFKEIKWPGLITIINYKADQLFLNIQIKRDALLIDSTGMSIANANYPVNDAIAEFMKELPFNGELRLSALVDKLQLVPGVIDATILSAQSAWINPEINGYDAPQPIFISKVAVSGYFEVVNYDNITYVV